MRRNTMALMAAVLMAGAFSMTTTTAKAASSRLACDTPVLGCGSWVVHIYRDCRGWVCVGEFRSRCEAYEVAHEYESRGYDVRVRRSYS